MRRLWKWNWSGCLTGRKDTKLVSLSSHLLFFLFFIFWFRNSARSSCLDRTARQACCTFFSFMHCIPIPRAIPIPTLRRTHRNRSLHRSPLTM
ncbi:hypothetical protein B0J11DRAFT_532133 [Dendryphion nanum]|uniref:Uncharacterized protein n=1 Tax=Dendryphion nanum TaxID=256645 RepID=A0A9P9DP47_9PLEO|nr:hypothetical protein B0J11DRAFT_532133 [Dendryphion nanum]